MKVIIDGFVDKEHAKAFCDWYEGSGEQYSDEWMEECRVPSAYVDIEATYEKGVLKNVEEDSITIKIK